MTAGVVSLAINLFSWFSAIAVIIWIIYRKQFTEKWAIVLRYFLYGILDGSVFLFLNVIIKGEGYMSTLVNAIVSALFSILVMYLRTGNGSKRAVTVLEKMASK